MSVGDVHETQRVRARVVLRLSRFLAWDYYFNLLTTPAHQLIIRIVPNLKLPELYELYIGKNILNKFRQNHGYKEGSYIKEWNGKEDNVVMQEILASRSNITPQVLYLALEIAYPKV